MSTIVIAAWLRISTQLSHLRHRHDERGLTTTEVAVLTFVLVAIAVAIGALLFNYANDTVSNAPSPEIPDFSE